MVLLFSYFMARSVLREQVFKSMEVVVSRTRREVEITLADMNALASTLAARPQLVQDLDAYLGGTRGRDAIVADLNGVLGSAFTNGSSSRGLIVATADGTIIASTGTRGATPKVSEGVLDNIKPAHPITTFNLDSGGLVITVAYPVTTPGTGQVTGAMVVQNQSTALESELSDTSGLGTTGRILLSDFFAGKVSVVSFRDATQAGNTGGTATRGTLLRLPLDSNLAPVKAARGEKGEGEMNGLLGQVVASYDFIPGPEWGVTVTTDSGEAFSPIYKLRNVSIIVILVLLFGGSLPRT